MDITAKTYRYMDDGETSSKPAKKKSGGAT
jgi:hypothetical protein